LTGKLIKLVQELYLAQFASVSFQTLQARPCNSSHTALREPTTMISLEDCIAICGLDADQVAAIAEHEHISEMAAAAACELCAQAGWRTRAPPGDCDALYRRSTLHPVPGVKLRPNNRRLVLMRSINRLAWIGSSALSQSSADDPDP
jgi:hypothetical protein